MLKVLKRNYKIQKATQIAKNELGIDLSQLANSASSEAAFWRDELGDMLECEKLNEKELALVIAEPLAKKVSEPAHLEIVQERVKLWANIGTVRKRLADAFLSELRTNSSNTDECVSTDPPGHGDEFVEEDDPIPFDNVEGAATVSEIGNTNATKQSDRDVLIIHTVTTVLTAQFALAENHLKDVRDETHRLFILGYILGTIDSVLQSYGIPMDNKAVAIATVIYTRLFGRQGAELLDQSMMHSKKHEDNFMEGMRTGGQEMADWMRGEGEETPLGLSRILSSP